MNFQLMSMAELSTFAKDVTNDRKERLKALYELNHREAKTLDQLKSHRWPMGGVRPPNNYVPDL